MDTVREDKALKEEKESDRLKRLVANQALIIQVLKELAGGTALALVIRLETPVR